MRSEASLPEYLSVLNPEQREAVLHQGRSLLILAGAGSGKTRVITTKIAYLIRERGVAPESILAVTFTNKAAREMAERAARIEPNASRAMLRTFHSFGAWLLRRNAALVDLPSSFTIYDDDDSVTLLSSIMTDATRPQVAKVAHAIARAKDYFLSPEALELDLIDHRPEFRKLYAAYEERLGRTGNVDFGDLIKKPVDAMRAHPEFAARLRQRFRFILVDEYQDSNVAQFEFLKTLVGDDASVCVVGDDDQSIYRFRGAEVRNILEFPDRFSETTVVRLERNYRSVAPILQAAGAVVNNNHDRLGKTLRAERGDGKKPTAAFLPDQDAEASFCAELVARSSGPGKGRYADWAILYRTNAQSLGFESEFLRRRIPYRVVGSLKFYEREEVKDALALLAFAVNPRDEVAFRRVVNKPTRGVGPATVERIVAAAQALARSGASAGSSDYGDLTVAARQVAPLLSKKARAGLETFLSVVSVAFGDFVADASAGVNSGLDLASSDSSDQATLRGGEGLSAFLVRIVTDSGIVDYHRSQDEVSGTQRLSNLQELANAASLYPPSLDGLVEFLEHIELDRAMEEKSSDDDAVTLITLHNTKGLEFRKVIMTGLEQGVFPRDDKHDEDLEEERRLFYVGATRAMDELYLTSCAVRRLYGRTAYSPPSLFLQELPSSIVRFVGDVPAGFGSASGSRDAVSEWPRGTRVYHDEFGYGSVVASSTSEEGPVVSVRFESGGEYRFLPQHQVGVLLRIRQDDY